MLILKKLWFSQNDLLTRVNYEIVLRKEKKRKDTDRQEGVLCVCLFQNFQIINSNTESFSFNKFKTSILRARPPIPAAKFLRRAHTTNTAQVVLKDVKGGWF